MNFHKIAIQGPNNGSATLKLIKQVASLNGYDNVIGQFAYATKGGVQLLKDVLSSEINNWQTIRKRWLISLDFGLTEPEALEGLMSIPNSEVKVPYANDVLKKGLKPKLCFHSKSMFFYKRELDNGPTGIYVGSANMSISGLSCGHENAMAAAWTKVNSKSKRQLGLFLNDFGLIEDIYNSSTTVDSTLLARYSALRGNKVQNLEDNGQHIKDIIALLDSNELRMAFSEAVILSTAKRFWLEGGYIVKNRGPSRPGNQIDLPRGASVFFGFPVANLDKNTHIGDIVIAYRKYADTYSLRLGNNYMEKLSLPIPGEVGPDTYERCVLLFTKDSNGRFELDVTGNDSSKAQSWIKKSMAQKTQFAMRSGRRFGVYE